MSDPDREARRSLARHRAFATSLLVVMGVVAVGSHWLPPTYASGLLEAAAKAGFIGGIADWFAVTALFRHPLGLPIPHTAIVPSHKERLGRALGNFVANHVFTESEVARTLSGLDLSGSSSASSRTSAPPAPPPAPWPRCSRGCWPPSRTAAPAASSPA